MATIKIAGRDVVSESYLLRYRNEIFPGANWSAVNSIKLRRGRKPSQADLLIDKATLDAINLNAANSIQIVHDGGTVTLQGWFPVECEAVSGRTGVGSVYHMVLRDRRCIGELHSWHKKDPVNWHVEASAPTPNISWSTALGSIWSELPSEGRGGSTSLPSLPVTPSSYAENLVFQGDTTWGAVVRALNACGLSIYFDTDNNTYTLIDPTATQSGLATQLSNASNIFGWDATVPNLAAGVCPENASLIFPVIDIARTDRIVPYSDNYYIQTGATSVSGVLSGTTLAYTDTSRARYNFSGGLIANQAQLDNRVTDFTRTVKGIAKTYNRKSARVYFGYVGVRPGSEITTVSYTLKGAGLRTKIEIENESWDIQLPFTLDPRQGPPHRLYKYTLSSGWTSGSATAAIKTLGDTEIAASATVRDPMSVAASLVSGNSGQCIMCDGEFIAIGGGRGGGDYIENLRLNGNDLQYYKSGTWTTWHTGESCTV